MRKQKFINTQTQKMRELYPEMICPKQITNMAIKARAALRLRNGA